MIRLDCPVMTKAAGYRLMKNTDWKSFIELIGIAAIVASLIFVGLELRQTRELAMAATYQARTDSEMSMYLATIQPDKLHQASEKVRRGEELSEEEQGYLAPFLGTMIVYFENAHYQWEIGLLPDDSWEVHLAQLRSGIANGQFPRGYWELARLNTRSGLREIIDSEFGKLAGAREE